MKEFKWLNGRSMTYPNHLKQNIPKCPNSWVDDQIIEKYGVSIHYLDDEEDAPPLLKLNQPFQKLTHTQS